MPKDDINYKFTENGIVYDFYDVFVPAENFRQPTLFTFGWNGGPGQLGDNTTISRSTPVTTFAGGTTWKQVSCGGYATSAIKTDGTLWIWGNNGDGKLGTNNTTSRSTPVTTFAGGNNWKQVSCGRFHTAAIKTDGSLWIWGRNNEGQLGDNTTTQRNIPVTTFSGGTNWKQVSCGRQYTTAIKTDGSLWGWGENNFGQLGDNTTTNRNIPVTTFAGGNNWKQVAGGYNHTAAIKTDGSLWTWGRNSYGALGTNDTNNRTTPVTTFTGGTNWKSVECGQASVAIKTDGSLWTWGRNNSGQLGNNTNTDRSTPVTTFAGGTNWKSVARGQDNISAIKTDGTLWNWGRGDLGMLGNNTNTSSNVPVTTFAGGNNWKQVSGGGGQTAAIKYSPDP
jgi:alpha-tubulin suppressor-like RCC1 family protein